eukprot:g2422.t1
MFCTPEQDDFVPLQFRDAILLFLTVLSNLRTSLTRTENINTMESEKTVLISKDNILSMEPPESPIEEDWIRADLLKRESFSCLSPEDPFTFTSQQEGFENLEKTQKIRLWDFITSTGVLSNQIEPSILQNNEWNQRNLNLAVFNRKPSSNPILKGFSSFFDGHCNLYLLDDSGNDEIPSISFQDLHNNRIPGPQRKENLEKELIQLIQLALDGNVPSIQYLESSARFSRASALHKLMTKVTRVGYLRNELDSWLVQSRSSKNDPIQNAFLDSIECILRWHSSALQSLIQCINDRQEADNGVRKSVSVVEAVLHTEKLRKQVCFLVALCRIDQSGTIMSLPEGPELLFRLYRDLLEADNQSSPMIRYLFCCCFHPFHVELRRWLYSTEMVSVNFQQLPVFLENVQEMVMETGQQLRVLAQVNTRLKLNEALISSIQRISECEINEMRRICAQFGDEWATCTTEFEKTGFIRSIGVKQDDSVPLPFHHDALHEVIEIQTQTSTTRSEEIRYLINCNRRIQKLETEIKNAEVLAQFQMRLAEIEEQRQNESYQSIRHGNTIQEIRVQQQQAIEQAEAFIEAELESNMEIDVEQTKSVHNEMLSSSPLQTSKQRATWDPPEMSLDDQKSEMMISEHHHSSPSGEIHECNSMEASIEELPANLNATSEEVLVPISAVLDGCILQPIIEQHRTISFAFSALFCEDSGFIKTASFLRQFYFAESADWIGILSEALFSHLAHGGNLSNRFLNDIMDTSFQDSTYQELISVKDQLGICLMLTDDEQSSVYQDPSSQSCASCLRLRSHIDWPLNLVLDEENLEEYNMVFQTLMKVHQARWWLNQLWTILQRDPQSLRNTVDLTLIPRLKKIRLWYQDALNIVTTIQGYIHHELHFSHWQFFQTKMNQSGLSLMKIKTVQKEYMKRSLDTCFLTNSSRRLRSMMESALQSIVNFCNVVKESTTPETQCPLVVLLKNDSAWMELEKLFMELRHRTTAFYKTLKYRANRGECTEALLVLMSFNSYYGPAH